MKRAILPLAIAAIVGSCDNKQAKNQFYVGYDVTTNTPMQTLHVQQNEDAKVYSLNTFDNQGNYVKHTMIDKDKDYDLDKTTTSTNTVATQISESPYKKYTPQERFLKAYNISERVSFRNETTFPYLGETWKQVTLSTYNSVNEEKNVPQLFSRQE